MTDRELKKLSRADLLELLLEQMKENEQLRGELEAAQGRLEEREIAIDSAGSIAQAALELNGVFQAAQDACDQYIENIALLRARQEELCARMERETQEKCSRMVEQAKGEAQTYWEDVSRRVKELTASSYQELRRKLRQLPRDGGQD